MPSLAAGAPPTVSRSSARLRGDFQLGLPFRQTEAERWRQKQSALPEMEPTDQASDEEHHHGIQVDEMKREACGYGVGVSDGEIDSPFGHRPPSRGERRMGSGALLTLIACGLALASAAKAATFLVSKTADTNDGACDADCSLREAVIAANAAAGADTIVVPTGTFLLTIPERRRRLRRERRPRHPG